MNFGRDVGLRKGEFGKDGFVITVVWEVKFEPGSGGVKNDSHYHLTYSRAFISKDICLNDLVVGCHIHITTSFSQIHKGRGS